MTVLPTIHLNGTGATSLAAEYGALEVALREAQEALQASTCHARDFYPQGEAAFFQARLERERVAAALAEALKYAQEWRYAAMNSPLYR